MGVYEHDPEILSVSASSPGAGTPDADFNMFKGAACPTAGTCYLDGFAAPNGGAEVTTVTNGVAGPGQAVSGSYELVGAACSSDGTCWAVGWGNNEQPPGAAVQLSSGDLDTIAGTVSDTKGKPVPGATISLNGTTDGGDAVSQSALTAADGTYEFKVPPGTYTAGAAGTPTGQASDGTWTTASCSGTSSADAARCTVTLASGASATASFDYLLPDLQAEDLEITQGIQDDVWDSPTSVDVPGLGSEPGGLYTGVKLVRGVPTVVRLYASVYPDPTAQSVPGVPAELHAYSDADGTLSELPGSPITAPERTLEVGPVEPAARLAPEGAYTFTLPPAWTKQPEITLVAQVDPETNGERPVHECAKCDTNDDYALSQITFTPTAPITIEPFEIAYTYLRLHGKGSVRETGPDLSPLLERAQDVLPLAPGALKIEQYPQTVLDVTPGIQKVVHWWRARNKVSLFSPDLSDCVVIPVCRGDVEAYELDAIQRLLALPHGPHLFRFGFEPVPDGVTYTALGTSMIGPDSPPRPLTSATHELLHDLGFLHASPGCGGGANGQVNAPWPPDQLGYIQGVGLDRRPNSGGPGRYRIIAPGVGAPQYYDLMSYCTLGNDAISWISTINWNTFVSVDGVSTGTSHDLTRTAGTAGASAAAAGPRMVIDAALSLDGATQVLGAGPSSDPLSRSVASPYALKVIGAGGQTLSDVGVAPEQLDDSPAQFISATVPSTGAQTLELTSGTHVLARLVKPSPAPSVTLSVPRRARAGRALTVTWHARGARGVTLITTVQYLTSAAQGWMTAAAGVQVSRWTISAATLRSARSVRIRVLVNDGFSDAVATSRTLRIH